MTEVKHLVRCLVTSIITALIAFQSVSQPSSADSESSDIESSGDTTSISHSNEITAFWNVSDESNKKSITHTAWQDILDNFLEEHDSGINRFDYTALKEDLERMESLIEYLLQLSELDPRSHSKSEQLAYWINLYNATAVYLVASQSPVKSIKDIKFANSSAWRLLLLT